MKITKSYLKQIIKEEVEKQISSTTKSVIITPEEFLKLTTTPNVDKELDAREASLSYDPFEVAKEQPFLTVNNNGKVINHEGRLRARSLIKKGIQSYKININFPKDFDINKPNLMIFGQYDDERSITINKQQNSSVELSALEQLNSLNPDSFSGRMRDIVLKLVKEKNISKEEAANLLNNELQKYDVIIEPTREQEFAIMIVTSPMVSARIYKKDYKEGSILNDPKSKQFSNPLSYKDKVTLRKK